MKCYIPYESKLYKQRVDRWAFNGFCHQTSRLLRMHPQGVTLANVQRTIGLSAKTAKAVLSAVAVEKDGIFYNLTNHSEDKDE